MPDSTSLGTATRLLWVGSGDPPANLLQAVERRWELVAYDSRSPLAGQLAQTGLAVISIADYEQDPVRLGELLEQLACSPAAAIFMLPDGPTTCGAMLDRRGGQFLCVTRDAPADQLSAKLSAAAELQPAIVHLREELAAARQSGGSHHDRNGLAELDEQLRLASRLQLDFLPRRLPELGEVRFAALYHPAGWVSGDIYDVTRLDETHVGFYVADAVGHGMPAALLTMFIKKALQTKRIAGNSYQIIPPGASLQELNRDICDQQLPSCQFCTAVYCLVDVSSMTLTFSRAGHPEPILVRSSGAAEALTCPGSLLGAFDDAQYPSRQIQLAAGDRLVLYTDGLEGVFSRSADGRPPNLRKIFSASSGMSRQEVLLRITDRIQSAPPSAQREDDVTVLIMDIGRE